MQKNIRFNKIELNTTKIGILYNGKWLSDDKIIASTIKISTQANIKYLKVAKNIKSKSRFCICKKHKNNQLEYKDIHRTLQNANHTWHWREQRQKTPEANQIHLEFLMNLGMKGRTLLHQLHNLSWTSSLSAEWKKTIIIPNQKKKPANEVSSFWPVPLTNIVVKVIETMVSNRLTWFLECEQLLTQEQAELCTNHSTNYLSQSRHPKSFQQTRKHNSHLYWLSKCLWQSGDVNCLINCGCSVNAYIFTWIHV